MYLSSTYIHNYSRCFLPCQGQNVEITYIDICLLIVGVTYITIEI